MFGFHFFQRVTYQSQTLILTIHFVKPTSTIIHFLKSEILLKINETKSRYTEINGEKRNA